MRARVAKWKPAEHRSADRLTEPGLEHIYRAGHTGRRRARSASPAPGRCTSGANTSRTCATPPKSSTSANRRTPSASKRIAKLARRADGLGEMLGEEHDLMLLAEKVRGHKPLQRRRKRSRKLLLRAISRRRARLRRQALREGERLYERKPKRFVRRARTAHTRTARA